MTKDELRREVRRAKVLHTGEMTEWSETLCRRIHALTEWERARTVLLYHALPDEPQLQSLLDEAVAEGKQVVLPVVVGDDLVIRRYEGRERMAEGAFHIMEPMGEDLSADVYKDIDLAIVPGMAFDKEGHRLGRGRGYYDRLLPRLTATKRVGVCFPFQYFEDIPHERHDVRMDSVVLP